MEQIELIRHAVSTLDALAVPYALVGSWGSGLYGEPRFTSVKDTANYALALAGMVGITSLSALAGLTVDQLVQLGVRRSAARTIWSYVRRRSQ
jgi:hypothetical protein